MSSTNIVLNGIDMLDASEYLCNPAGKTLVWLTLHDLLYRITLESKAPLFLQLSQRSSGEVDAVIPNTEAELMAKRMNVQISAWCHFYWKELNPGAKKFYRKLSDRAFSQVLLHEIGECKWDPSLKAVSSPSLQSKMSAIAEFEEQDWVKLLSQDSSTQRPKKTHVDPNVAFPFQDDFLVGTIHGANVKMTIQETAAAPTATDVVEIQDGNDEVSVLTSKTTCEGYSNATLGSWVASGSNLVSGLTATPTESGTANGAVPTGGGARGPDGK